MTWPWVFDLGADTVTLLGKRKAGPGKAAVAPM